MRAKDEELRAMSALSNDPNFMVFMSYLKTWLKDETKECIHNKEPAVSQGRAQVLTEIKDTVDEARESVKQRVSKRAVSSVHRANAF